jgi:hypothetical protein
MSSINPYNYIDQTKINSNKYDSNYNRFGKREKPLYELKSSPQTKVEIREINIDDLVNDAFIDRLKNTTNDGVRIRDNYILNEPIDIKTTRHSATIYRDNKKESTADKYKREKDLLRKEAELNAKEVIAGLFKDNNMVPKTKGKVKGTKNKNYPFK